MRGTAAAVHERDAYELWLAMVPPRTARGVSMAAWEKLSAYNPRMLLGFNEVSIKSWLEAFKGRVPPPDGQHPEYDRGYWRFSKVVYDLRTRHRLALPARTAVRP